MNPTGKTDLNLGRQTRSLDASHCQESTDLLKKRRPDLDSDREHLRSSSDDEKNNNFIMKSEGGNKKRVADAPSVIQVLANKKVRPMSTRNLADETIERIRKSPDCNKALEDAKSHNFPEIFIDIKDQGKRIITVGRDVISEFQRDDSLMAMGQAPEGPLARGRVYIALPWLNRLEILDEFAQIKKSESSMALLSHICDVGLVAEKETLGDSDAYASLARLDLVFRFGLLGCERDISVANFIKDRVPLDKRGQAYSLALQDAAGHNHVGMMQYCFMNDASPFSPPNDDHDYRDWSPIEIAFLVGSNEAKEIMVQNLEIKRDLSEIKELFLDVERWPELPKEIAKFFKNEGRTKT